MQDPYTEALWGATTAPTDHDPNSYRYLVHMDTGVTTIRPFIGQRTKFFYSNPSRIAKPKGSKYISASLISADKSPTFPFSSHGIILETPPEGVVLTSGGDTYSKMVDYDQLAMFHDHVLSPDEVLASTKDCFHNEVLLDPKAVSVVGLVFVITPRKFSLCPVDLNTVKHSAEQLGLPLVEI